MADVLLELIEGFAPGFPDDIEQIIRAEPVEPGQASLEDRGDEEI
ncbi:hypothetical protein [Mesorhizobium sp. B2-3-4]|nr:hypothetical protein [Mesorhizobium sp. B2-3-4]